MQIQYWSEYLPYRMPIQSETAGNGSSVPISQFYKNFTEQPHFIKWQIDKKFVRTVTQFKNILPKVTWNNTGHFQSIITNISKANTIVTIEDLWHIQLVTKLFENLLPISIYTDFSKPIIYAALVTLDVFGKQKGI